MGEAAQEIVIWAPQPRQEAALACPVEDILFGGARGGGKSDWLLAEWIQHAHRHPRHARGLIVRRTLDELEELQSRAEEIFPITGAIYRAGKRRWLWPGGSRVSFRYLARDEDASHYQGWGLTFVAPDEITNFPSPTPLDRLRASMRSAHGVPCIFRATGNPGGPGHNWVKARYVDPSPPGIPHWDEEGKTFRVYIPSRLDDNLILQRNDPNYWQRVEAAACGRPDLLKAWRWGIWDIVAGGMFDDVWSPAHHLLRPFRLPMAWKIDRSFDWGSSKPFAVPWFAETNGEEVELADGQRRSFYPGSLIIAMELYGWNGKPNQGLHLANSEIARRILEAEAGSGFKTRIVPGPADNSIYDIVNGQSIADEMQRAGVGWTRSNKGPGSRVTGWQAIRGMLQAATKYPMEEPGLFVFDTCRHVIRTLPVLPRDPKNMDDVDTEAEDHLGDALRYRVLTRGSRAGAFKW